MATSTKQAIIDFANELVELTGNEDGFMDMGTNMSTTHELFDGLYKDLMTNSYRDINILGDIQISMPTASIPKSNEIVGNTINNLLDKHIGLRHDTQLSEIPLIQTLDYGIYVSFKETWDFTNTSFVVGGNRLCYKIKTGTLYTFAIECTLINAESVTCTIKVGKEDSSLDIFVPQEVTLVPGQNTILLTSMSLITRNDPDIYMRLENIKFNGSSPDIAKIEVSLGNPILIEGDYKDIYIKYIEGMKSVAENGTINVLSICKNFIDEKKIVKDINYKGYGWHSGLNPARVMPNTRMLLTNDGVIQPVYVVYYNSALEVIKEEETREIFTPNNCVYLKVFGPGTPNKILLEATQKDPTPHERYRSISKTIYTNPIRYINRDFYDKIILKSGNPIIERMVGEIELGDGIHKLEYCPGYDKAKTKLFRIKVPDMKPFITENTFTFQCDRFKVGKKDADDRATISGDTRYNNYIFVRIESMFINNNPEDINEFFEANRTKILYPLQEAKQEKLDYGNDINLYLRRGMNTIFLLDDVNPTFITTYPVSAKSLIDEIANKIKFIPITANYLFTRDLYKYDCISSMYFDRTVKYVEELDPDNPNPSVVVNHYCYETLDTAGIYRLAIMDTLSNLSKGTGMTIGFNRTTMYNDNKMTVETKGKSIDLIDNKLIPSGNGVKLGSLVSQLNSIHMDNSIILGAGDTRPVTTRISSWFFDTTINKPIWWNGHTWTDIEGNKV